MSRTTSAPAVMADPRISFPRTEAPLACQTNPAWFIHEYGQTGPDDADRIERAKTACGGCPIADGCLKWALANPQLTPSGIWAATTARQRTALRRRLQIRLGLDWVGVVAQADRAQNARCAAPQPSAADQAPPAHPLWSSHYEPWREPISPDQQQRNRELLDIAQRKPRTTAA
ncbi:WhiB family transcriptional regulator [Streptomyces sp. NPDC020792]|uniref:WhiB family transcriptional regulator n=1 Tax=Streptomyces sp. NPDC020792 TaxID=3365089 RepID=UPI00379F58BE